MSKSDWTVDEEHNQNPHGMQIMRRAEEYDIPLAGDSDLIAAFAGLAPPQDLPAELEAAISALFDHAQAVRDSMEGVD